MADLLEDDGDGDGVLVYYVVGDCFPSEEDVKTLGAGKKLPAEHKSLGQILTWLLGSIKRSNVGAESVYLLRGKELLYWSPFSEFLNAFLPPHTKSLFVRVGIPPTETTPVPAAAAVLRWCSDTIVSALLSDYKHILVRSRSVVGASIRDDTQPLQLTEGGSIEDVGAHFPVVGREETSLIALVSCMRMFRIFFRQNDASLLLSEASFNEKYTFFFALIAFPGAGKTTFGLSAQEFLVQHWNCLPEDTQNAMLEREFRNTSSKAAFVEMLQYSSKSYNLSCYHMLETQTDGSCLASEKPLAEEQILSLRCLHAAIFKETRSYGDFLNELEQHHPGLINHLTFSQVVNFVRAGLDVPPEQQIQLSFFMDEANRAREGLNLLVNPNPSCLHCCLSAYRKTVYKMYSNRSKTFPVLWVGTRHFSAVDMRFAETGNAAAVFLPFRALRDGEVANVLLHFWKRLCRCVGVKKLKGLPGWLHEFFSFLGGIPRLIAFALEGTVDAGATSPRNLYNELRKERSSLEFGGILINLLEDVKGRHYFCNYVGHATKTDLLMVALGAAALGKSVCRAEKVMKNHDDNWGALEAEGIVTLNTFKRAGRKRRRDQRQDLPWRDHGQDLLRFFNGSTSEVNVESIYQMVDMQTQILVEPGVSQAEVSICPLLLIYMFKSAFPKVHELVQQDWYFSKCCDRSRADLQALLFKLRFLQVFHGAKTFRLVDIYPPDAVPLNLAELVFKIPCEGEQLVELGDQPGFDKTQIHKLNAPDCWFCAYDLEGAYCYLILRSEKGNQREHVNTDQIFGSFKFDCGKWFEVPTLSRAQEKMVFLQESFWSFCLDSIGAIEIPTDETPEFIYLYCTEEEVSFNTMRSLDNMLEVGHPWARRTIFLNGYGDTTNSYPFKLLSQLRDAQAFSFQKTYI